MFGLLNINKHAGVTSRAIVDAVQRVTSLKRIGHAGTLDPMATGVLVLLLGPATRLTDYVQRMPKTYVAEFEFGLTSDTDDIWGQCEIKTGRTFEQSQLQNALAKFVGEIDQVPPKISAVKINGRRAYKLARRGKDVQPTARKVSVHEINLLDFEFPKCRLEIKCGSGTYIRSLARDIGEVLECPAVMSGLIRSRIGFFDLDNSINVEDLSLQQLQDHLHPPSAAVAHLSKVEVDDEQIRRMSVGKSLLLNEAGDEMAAVNQAGELMAVISKRSTSNDTAEYKPKINFVPILMAD